MENKNYASFVPVTGTIISINAGEDCCSQMMSLRAGDGIVNFMIDAETQVIGSRRLWPGMLVTAFYDSSLPVPLIFPPQYRAQIVTPVGRNEQVMIGTFGTDLIASDGSLKLNIAYNTQIRTINGQNFNCNLVGRTLLVYYTTTTRSVPPQTTPDRIIVLC